MSTDNPQPGSAESDQVAAQQARLSEYRQSFEVAADAIADAIRAGGGDGGELICHLVATVAANLGSIDAVTAGRPGSWEADLVQQILSSTVGQGDLLYWRTAPIEIVEHVDALLDGMDLGEALYDASLNQIWAALEADGHGVETGDPALRQLTVEGEALYEAAIEPLNQLRTEDFARYTESFEAAVRIVVDRLVIHEGLPAEVSASVRWVDYEEGYDDIREMLTPDVAGARFDIQYGPLTDVPLESGSGPKPGRLPYRRASPRHWKSSRLVAIW